jgi:hypothetical protein
MQAAKLARDEFPGEGPEGFKQVTIAAENVPSLFGVQTAKKQTGAPHDETQPHDAWEKIDAAQDGKRATEQVVNTFKRVQASAARLVEHEEELEAAGQQRRNDADGEALASEISEARQQLAEAKRRAGISP